MHNLNRSIGPHTHKHKNKNNNKKQVKNGKR